MSWTRNEEKEAQREQLAQEAMALIEQAEQLEIQEQWAKAAYTYQQAAEKLQRSGYATHFISDIYSKATDCNNRVKLVKQGKPVMHTGGQIQDRQQTESLEQQGVSLLNNAKQLMKEQRYGEALDQYLSAANLLTQAGWKPEQLEGIKGEITQLQQLMATGSPNTQGKQ